MANSSKEKQVVYELTSKGKAAAWEKVRKESGTQLWFPADESYFNRGWDAAVEFFFPSVKG